MFRSSLIITFSRGVAALVLDPIIDGYRLSKVLMDGDNNLDHIYEDTLRKMQFDGFRIQSSKTTFKRIVRGKEACCTGKVTLDVARLGERREVVPSE